MFQVGDFIVYGSRGVCIVEEIGTLDIPGVPKDRMYYTLSPCYESKSKIFTPVDNQKVIMRPVLKKEEALQLIDEMKEIHLLGISDEKRREEEYKSSLQTCDCKELIRVIKTIYLRGQKRKAEGKKITSQDERYFHMAEQNLSGELAIALGIDRDQVKSFVKERMEQSLQTR